MLKLRRSEQRGHTDLGWLDSRHTFSFGHYFDRNYLGFKSLRVINDDVVAPGGGFPTHPHADMEILTYVVDGALEHRDSLGNGSVLRAGEFQRMTAGTGIEHSEFNPSSEDEVRLLQIWLRPRTEGLAPSYDQRPLQLSENQGEWVLAASPAGSSDDNSAELKIQQDAFVYAGQFDGRDRTELPIPAGAAAWIQVVDGELTVNGETASRGDGVAVEDEPVVTVAATGGPATALLFCHGVDSQSRRVVSLLHGEAARRRRGDGCGLRHLLTAPSSLAPPLPHSPLA